VQLLGSRPGDGGSSSNEAAGNNYPPAQNYAQPATPAQSAGDLTEPLDDLPF
ncbi:MAG: hypothetical protein RLZZ28_1008, partial [Bacteroidota bacterium]